MRKIVDAQWLCTNVGIVCVDDEYDGIKYYIGAIQGIDEEADKQFIADYGMSFPKDAGNVLFGRNG